MTSVWQKGQAALRCVARIPLVPLLLVVVLGGCGGLDENDLRRYAIRRPPDPEDQRDEKKDRDAEDRSADPAPAVQAPPVTAVAARPAGQAGAEADPQQEEPREESSNAAVAGVEDRLPPIPSDLGPAGKYGRSVANMRRISEALTAYVKDNGVLPPQGHPSVSWRVRLLPYLGYSDLYDRYDQKRSWFDPKNQELLAEIPSEYQSPERRDSRTNYLVVAGSRTVFGVKGEVDKRAMRFGSNLILIEADDSMAVNWTEPKDYPFDPRSKSAYYDGIGGLRNGEFLALTMDMRLLSMPRLKALGRRGLRQYFYTDGDEGAPNPKSVADDVAKIEYAAFEEAQSGVKFVSAEPAPSSAGPIRVGGAPASVVGSASSNLGVDCWQAAASAAEVGEASAAWRWARGAAVAGLTASQWDSEYRWFSGLRRPSLGLQVAVGLPGQPNRGGGSGRRGSGRRGEAGPQLFLRQTGEVGERLLREINEAVARAAISPLQVEPEADGGATREQAVSAPLTFILDTPSASTAAEKAREAGADVLVFFDWSSAPGGRGEEVSVVVYDLFRSKRLCKTDRVLVRSGTVDGQRLQENLKRLRWELKDFFEDNLSPQEWPVRMNPKMARKRLETLGARAGRAMPLTALVEMQHYRQKGLIDDAELLEGVEGVVGKSDAMALVLGDPTKRRRVLREWLPSDDPAEYVAQLESQRVAAKDDD